MNFGKKHTVHYETSLLRIIEYRYWVCGLHWRIQVGALVHRFGRVERVLTHKWSVIVRIGRHLVNITLKRRSLSWFYSNKRSKTRRSFYKQF